jgi:uncharacterized protein
MSAGRPTAPRVSEGPGDSEKPGVSGSADASAGVSDVSEPPGASEPPGVSEADIAAVTAQLGRPPRGVRAVAHRCPCGLPTVVQTAPRLPDGTPFPTLYYLTCSRLCSRISGVEASGRMREMTDRLATDPELATSYRRAHQTYLTERDAIEPLGTEVSAGGMPERVKCLHVHVAHTLARGAGVNPSGDDALARLAPWWASGPCVD